MAPGVSTVRQSCIVPIEDVRSCGLGVVTEVAFEAKLDVSPVEVHWSWQSV